ncbi:MAG: trypsin-like peptidase domain-containing protein [Nitrospiraceae bacterium]|nr:MAG: trypsin-like peptidase domain-containing protein [Nitrospiraceae bacterium]
MVFITGPAGADYKPDEKVLPLPTVELEIIIIRWLFDNGFDASHNTAAYNQTLIMVRKGDNKWQITVTAFSPLASRVSVTCLNNNEDKTELPGLWAYLDMYIQDEGTNSPFISESAPEFFRPYSESVVCIKGTNHKEPVQFTGFILDRDDIVISTAHDLEGVRNLEITFYNGKKTTGTIIRSDHEKDLSLIKINSAIKSSISLKKGRTLLNDNETVYSIGCPMNSNGKVHSGLIDGTIKRINSVFLWQAQIETRPGSSGSPVFDAEGNLVGVVKGSYRGTESIGFIISMRTVLDLLQEL